MSEATRAENLEVSREIITLEATAVYWEPNIVGKIYDSYLPPGRELVGNWTAEIAEYTDGRTKVYYNAPGREPGWTPIISFDKNQERFRYSMIYPNGRV